ncbi:MAG TPA: glycosyltransferase [Gaiellaceae bacterium]|nr:glycosyltransferase [Gaiellaceae bacterium]
MGEIAAVIPNRNGAGFVGTCVEAARRARIDQVVVVDDGSSDDSAAEAAEAGATVVAARGRGFAEAVAQGLASTETPYVLVLNSDCFLDEDAVGALAAALDHDERLALVGAGMRTPDGGDSKSHGPLISLGDALRALVTGRSGRSSPRAGEGLQRCDFVPLACALARRSAWDSVGGIDPGYFFYFEDYDLCWRLAAAGWRIAVCWDAGAIHVGGASSSARESRPWVRQYYVSLSRYLRKRYRARWLAFAAVWVPYALVQTARTPSRASAYLGSVPAVLFPPR